MFTKKIFAMLCLVALISLPAIYSEAAVKPTFAVLPFTNKSARAGTATTEAALDAACEYVKAALEHTNRFNPVDRDNENIKKLIENMRFEHESGLVNPVGIAAYGKMLGAEYLVLGTVTGLAKRGNDTVVNLSLRMIKVETAEIFLSGFGKGKSSYGEAEALEKAAKDALNGEMGMLTMLRGGK